jgi:hypothetical protein
MGGKQREGIVDRIQDRMKEREEHTGYGDSFQPRGVSLP